MVAESFAKSLQGYHRRRPFRPFLVDLMKGDRLKIDHPEALAFRGTGVAIFIGLDGGFKLLDHESVCSLSDLPPQEVSGPSGE